MTVQAKVQACGNHKITTCCRPQTGVRASSWHWNRHVSDTSWSESLKCLVRYRHIVWCNHATTVCCRVNCSVMWYFVSWVWLQVWWSNVEYLKYRRCFKCCC